MKKLKCLTVIIFLLSNCFAFGQDEKVWMYGWRPAATQELYDFYMVRLYVTKPYVQEDYERDVFHLYSGLQNYKKLSDYCQGKTKDSYDKKSILNVKGAYQAWKEENKDYIQLINSLWGSLVKDIKTDKSRELVAKIEEQNKNSVPSFESSENVDRQCQKTYMRFAYQDRDGKIIGRASEEKRFSDAYRNLDFFLHPEKKEEFKKALKKQLDGGLAGEKTCKKSGGTWRPVGMAQSMSCVTTYPDAGKSCTDSSQCKGGCVDVTPYNHKGKPTGQCKKDDDDFGCIAHIENGVREGPKLCVD